MDSAEQQITGGVGGIRGWDDGLGKKRVTRRYARRYCAVGTSSSGVSRRLLEAQGCAGK